jgi:hypothetical protein
MQPFIHRCKAYEIMTNSSLGLIVFIITQSSSIGKSLRAFLFFLEIMILVDNVFDILVLVDSTPFYQRSCQC